MPRLFVALDLPQDIRDALIDLDTDIDGADWVPEENYHLTLRFLDEVDGGTMEDVHDALIQVRAPPFDLTLSGLGHFGHGSKLRALWAAVEPSAELALLQGRVESACRQAGLELEPVKFTPHVTLAYLRHADPVDVGHYLEANNRLRAGPFRVDRFHLYSSWPGDGAQTYLIEATYPLGTVE